MTPSTWDVFRSLAWLRWRILVNTITRSGARDLLERVSRTAQSLLPIAILVLLVPVAVSLLGAGAWVGRRIGAAPEENAWVLHLVRWPLLAMMLVTVLSPVLLPSGHQPAVLLRLLLLPISTRVLYVAHTIGALADAWVFLSIPLVAGVFAGLVASGALAAAAAASVAAVAFVATLLAIASLASAVLQLIVRNRQRAELLALAGMLLVIIVSIVPQVLFTDSEGRTGGRHETLTAVSGWLLAAGALVPSELYTRAVHFAARREPAGAALAIAALVGWAIALQVMTWPIYQRLLQTPATGGARRIAAGARGLSRSIPGFDKTVSAVAVSFTRLAYRTPRGRAVVLMPIVLLAGFATIVGVRDQAMPFGPVEVGGGYSLGIFGIVIALLSIGPLVFNQFAVDRAGLTLQFLSPIETRALLRGKAIGGALIAAVPCVAAVAAGVLTGGGSPVIWAAVILGAVASYLITAPVAAILSLLFPRAVDLSSIGQGSNAHQAAGLLGFLAFSASCVPAAALAMFGVRGLGSSGAVLLLLALWAGVAWGLSAIGFRIAERLLDQRRENLVMVAQGR